MNEKTSTIVDFVTSLLSLAKRSPDFRHGPNKHFIHLRKESKRKRAEEGKDLEMCRRYDSIFSYHEDMCHCKSNDSDEKSPRR
jgi:hypothetical protein